MTGIERNLLRIGIVLAVIYQLLQTFLSIWNESGTAEVALNLMVAVVFLFLLYPLSQFTQIVAFIFHFIVFVCFAFFWTNTNGVAGTVPCVMCFYIAFVAVVSKHYYRIVALLLFVALVAILVYFPEVLSVINHFGIAPSTLSQISFEFALVAILMASLICYMKISFQEFHSKSVKRFTQLQHVDARLQEQNDVLASRQEEISVINENLESLILERTREIEKKNAELSEYAFINAHMLRAPLSRVLGLANLMEGSPEEYPPEQLSQIKMLANEMDSIVREISNVLN